MVARLPAAPAAAARLRATGPVRAAARRRREPVWRQRLGGVSVVEVLGGPEAPPGSAPPRKTKPGVAAQIRRFGPRTEAAQVGSERCQRWLSRTATHAWPTCPADAAPIAEEADLAMPETYTSVHGGQPEAF